MRLTIELTPDQGAQLLAAAEAEGLEPRTLAQRFVMERLPNGTPPLHRTTHAPDAPVPSLDLKNQAAIDMLRAWIAEDATDDPEEIRQAEEELEGFKRALNATPAATGERPVFP